MAGAKTKDAPTMQDEADAIFGDAEQGSEANDFDDLLDEVVEDDSEGWVPSEKGEAVAGTVVKVGKQRSDFGPAGDPVWCPAITVESAEGKFRVIGYGAVLRRELMDANPRVGDKIAIKYFGEKLLRKGRYAGKPFKHFGVAVRRTPAAQDGKSLAEAMTEQVK